jgi:hypothetical protein
MDLAHWRGSNFDDNLSILLHRSVRGVHFFLATSCRGGFETRPYTVSLVHRRDTGFMLPINI